MTHSFKYPFPSTGLLIALAACAPRPTDGPVPRSDATPDASPDASPDTAECFGTIQPPDGPCRCQSDCAPGALCSLEAESGAPIGRCLTPCQASERPPEGFVCLSIAGQMRLSQRCDRLTSCRDGWACTTEGAPPHCVPFCTADGQCDSGICDRVTGQCAQTRPAEGGSGVGAACGTNRACAGRVCLPGSSGFVGGYCSARCIVTEGPCVGDGFCYLPARDRDIGLQIGLCFRPCNLVSECREGYFCTPAGARSVCFFR